MEQLREALDDLRLANQVLSDAAGAEAQAETVANEARRRWRAAKQRVGKLIEISTRPLNAE